MSTPSNVLTAVPAMVGRSKIVFPSVPSVLPVLTLSSIAGGAHSGPRELYAYATWIIQTQDGTQYESLPGPEVSFAVASHYLLTATIQSVPQMPYANVGWNLYASGSSAMETQQSFGLALSATWIQPTAGTGIVVGTNPPTVWGYELIFKYPGRNFPYFSPSWHGHDDFSTGGWQQSITWYVDELMPIEVPYISADRDAWAWKQFLGAAVRRVPFDFYPDSTQQSFQTLVSMDSAPSMTYKAAGLYSLKMKCRKVILAI